MKIKKRLVIALEKFYEEVKLGTIRIDNVKDELNKKEEFDDKEFKILKNEVKDCRNIFKSKLCDLDDILYKDM